MNTSFKLGLSSGREHVYACISPILIVVWMIFMSTSMQAQSQVDQLQSDAFSALKEKRFDRAVTLFKELLQHEKELSSDFRCYVYGILGTVYLNELDDTESGELMIQKTLDCIDSNVSKESAVENLSQCFRVLSKAYYNNLPLMEKVALRLLTYDSLNYPMHANLVTLYQKAGNSRKACEHYAVLKRKNSNLYIKLRDAGFDSECSKYQSKEGEGKRTPNGFASEDEVSKWLSRGSWSLVSSNPNNTMNLKFENTRFREWGRDPMQTQPFDDYQAYRFCSVDGATFKIARINYEYEFSSACNLHNRGMYFTRVSEDTMDLRLEAGGGTMRFERR